MRKFKKMEVAILDAIDWHYIGYGFNFGDVARLNNRTIDEKKKVEKKKTDEKNHQNRIGQYCQNIVDYRKMFESARESNKVDKSIPILPDINKSYDSIDCIEYKENEYMLNNNRILFLKIIMGGK